MNKLPIFIVLGAFIIASTLQLYFNRPNFLFGPKYKVGDCAVSIEKREFESDYTTIIQIDKVGKEFYQFTYVEITIFPSLTGKANTQKINTIDWVYDKTECPK